MWHLQRTVPDWDKSLHILPNGSMLKATGGYEVFAEAKAINPTLFTVHRMVREELSHYYGTEASGWFNWEEAKRLAREWFNAFVDGTFRDKIEMHTDAVSWHNEIWANSQNQIERRERINAARAAIHIWNTEFRKTFSHDIKLIIGEAAIGNHMPREIGELAVTTDNIVGYHPYDFWKYKSRGRGTYISEGSLYHDWMERSWGLKPQWAFTEAGPYEAAETGWRSKECLGGDVDLYVDAVRQWIRDLSTTAAYKEGRIKGFALFTTFSPNDQKWGSFQTQQPEMNLLAQMIREEWKPGRYVPTDPPTVPPPDNSDEFHKYVWEVTVNKQVTGQGGLRLNPDAAIQREINKHNENGLQLQIVTDEVRHDGKVAQAAESLIGAVPRRVYVWEPGKKVYYFEDG